MSFQREAGEVEFRIFPPYTPAEPFIIEISKDRFVRRVPVDQMTARGLVLGRPDAVLARDIRTAVLAVQRNVRMRAAR